MGGLLRYERSLAEFVDRHRGMMLLLGALFVIGVVFGALAVSGVNPGDKAELVAWLKPAVQAMTAPDAGAGTLLLKQAVLRKLFFLALLWGLGISLLGAPGVMLFMLWRGFVTGFTVGFIVAEMGVGGLGVAVAGHLPQTLLEVPALLLAGTASAAFSLQVIRSWLERRKLNHFYPALARFTATLGATAAVLLVAGLVESYLSPVFIRFAASLLHIV